MKSTTHPSKGRVALLRLLVIALVGVTLHTLQTLNHSASLFDDTGATLSREPVIVDTVTLNGRTLAIPTYQLFQEDGLWSLTSRERPLKDENGFSLVNIPVAHGDEHLPMLVASPLSDNLESLVNAAEADGVSLMISSAHRTFAEQRETLDAFVAKNGRVLADAYVMPVGASEHHTGLAVDFSSVSSDCAEDSNTCSLSQSGAAWLAENAAQFGFILRYPEGKQSITGVGYEPWHYRYVGKPLALAMQDSSLTLEEVIEQIAPGYAARRN